MTQQPAPHVAARVAAHSVLEPLCSATAALLKPIGLMKNDRLEIGLDDEGKCFVVQAYAVRLDGTRVNASFNASQHWLARIPERRNIGYGRWSLKTTDFTALVINAIWPRDCITFIEDAAQIQYDFLLMRFAQQSMNAKKRAHFKLVSAVHTNNGDVSFVGAGKTLIDVRESLSSMLEKQAPENFIDHPRVPLTPYQLCMHHTSVYTEGCALFCEQGTGKTPPTIRRIMHEAHEHYEKTGDMYRAIVVAPKNVRTNWQSEIERFATVPGKVVVLRGLQLDRVKQLIEVMTPDDDSEYSIVVCSYETVKRSWDAVGMIHWHLAIADESHYIKSPTAQRTKVLLDLRDNSDARMILTGTPMANTVVDLFYQLEFLGAGQSGFSSFKAFRQYYHKYAKRRIGEKFHRLIGYKNLPILQERIARLAFVITKKEALPDLPDKMYDVEEVEMTPQQRDYYIKLQEQLAVEIEADLARAKAKGTNPKVTATHILTKLLRLAQITSGYVVSDKEVDEHGALIDDGDSRNHFFDPCPKIKRIVDILKVKGPLEKTIIWTCWVPTIEALSEELSIEGIRHVTYYGGTSDEERDAGVKAFNEDPRVKVFIGNPAAGGMGLNLPGYVPDWVDTDKDHGCNADHTIFYACNWSMIHRTQAEGRNHGKDRCRVPIRITDLVVAGTIDEEIRRRVLGKQIAALAVQDVRKIMERLLAADLVEDD